MDESSKKKRYCKLCGNEIDPVTKKCNGCGKQYFSLKHRIPVFLLIISLMGNVALGFLAYHNYRLYDQKYYEWLDEKANNAISESENRSKALFLDSHVVFTTESGSAYHKYDCYHLEGRDTFYWFREDAIAEGYSPCQDCY